MGLTTSASFSRVRGGRDTLNRLEQG